MNTAGRPEYYRPVQNGVRIYPDSDTAVSNGLKARIRRDITPFTSASTNPSPGFESINHEAVAIFMAYQHAKDETLAVASSLAGDWNNALEEISLHWRQKFRQHFPRMHKKRDHARAYL